MSDNSSDLGSFLSGMIIGGLIGAAAALLLAPQAGEDTRAQLKDKSIELRERAMETAEDARTRAESAAAEARARADELAAQARDRAEELRRRGQEVVEDQRSKINQAIDAGKDAAQRTQEQGGTPPSSEGANI